MIGPAHETRPDIEGACAVCGQPVALLRTCFYSGPGYVSDQRPDAPRRYWEYRAGLYHSPERAENYCGPACAGEGFRRAGEPPGSP